MPGFLGLPVIAIGALDVPIAPVVYPTLSRLASGGGLGQPQDLLRDVYIWDDGLTMIWDDDEPITIYG